MSHPFLEKSLFVESFLGFADTCIFLNFNFKHQTLGTLAHFRNTSNYNIREVLVNQDSGNDSGVKTYSWSGSIKDNIKAIACQAKALTLRDTRIRMVS